MAHDDLNAMVKKLRNLRASDVFDHPVFDDSYNALEHSMFQSTFDDFHEPEVLQEPKNIVFNDVDDKMQELKELSLMLNKQSDRFGLLLNEVNDYRSKLGGLENELQSLKNSLPQNEHVSKMEFNETKNHFNKIFAQTLKVVHDAKIEMGQMRNNLQNEPIEMPNLSHLEKFKKEQERFNKKFRNNLKLLNNLLLQETEEIRNKIDKKLGS